MSTIEEQIRLEKKMTAFGVARYKTGINKAKDGERGADVSSSQKLLHEYILPIAEALKTRLEFLERHPIGINAKFRKLFDVVEPETAIYLGLRTVFDFFTHNRSLVSLGMHIGMLIEDEAKFKQFQKDCPEYYNTIIRDFKKKGTKNYKHKHRVLTFKAAQKHIQWINWTPEERGKLGIIIIDLIMQNSNIIERAEEPVQSKKPRRKRIIIRPTQECIDWVRKFDAYAEMLTPDHTPCVVPPDPWISIDQGGYYTPQLRLRVPFVKVRNREQLKMFGDGMIPVMEAVNTLQATAWKINSRVLNVLVQAWNQSLPIGLPQSEPYAINPSPCPLNMKVKDMPPDILQEFNEWKVETRIIHTMNKERISKCFQVVRALKIAQEYKQYPRFYYVYYCDFRGRIYSRVHGLSPQGTDYAKALLHFADGVPLTAKGLHWLKIHGANCYGKDKLSYSDRVKWINENERMICDIADDALGTTEHWKSADKPWQFLAFCFEYREYKRSGLGILTQLPIGLDGSCNGLQNFSAMLRDEVGGKATNLVPGRVPSDIYSEVAKVCTEKLRQEAGELSKIWLDYCQKEHNGVIPRGLTKRPVMTLPYGSTQQSCREYIYKYMVEEAPLAFDPKIRFKLSLFLTPILWKSISKVVVAARQGMDWLQKCTTQLSRAGLPLYWTTPMGFPVFQQKFKFKTIQIRTELAGKIKLRVNKETTKMDTVKQRQGISPNFVHSLDACHLMKTILIAKGLGITQFACIHDDYGTNAEDTALLHTAIREAFVDLYSNSDPLQAFKDTNEKQLGTKLPDMPRKGKLDIESVRDSEYFFG